MINVAFRTPGNDKRWSTNIYYKQNSQQKLKFNNTFGLIFHTSYKISQCVSPKQNPKPMLYGLLKRKHTLKITQNRPNC